MANVISLGAHRWISEIRNHLPEGKTLREACIDAQKEEVALFKRLQEGKSLKQS